MKIRPLFNNKENCIKAASKLLLTLNVTVTTTTLENDLYNHPDYPSLLSISDVLAGYGVENISIKSTVDKLAEMPMPCIVPIKGESNSNLFTVIRSIKDHTVSYYHPEKYKWENIGIEDFEKNWPSGIVLLAGAEDARGEKDFISKRREEKQVNIAKYTTWLALPVFVILACVLAFAKYGASEGFPIIFTMLTLFGCIMGGLLLWYELDEYNPILQQICSAGKKVNCGAILNSKASKIAGISWSAIGFTYFAGGLFTLLFEGITNAGALFILAWFNVLAIPYVFFSVYYQWHIAKQWCVLCLCVQGVLVLQLVTALTAQWHTSMPVNQAFSTEIIIPVLFAYTIPFIMVSLLLPAYRSAKESKRNKTELQRLKHNPQIFEALLAKQKRVTENTAGLGIILGNPNATHKIIKVCNPYCGPCAKAHTPMEELLHSNPDVQIQILFTATNNEGDTKAPPVKHLLAIAEGGETITRQALDDWYLADKKDYEIFASKHPMNGELKQQDDKVNAMMEWCDKTQIDFTPTFFINGHQLPEIYSVSDLKYFLSV
ncbi:vitamin K epoxide reductase family protein [Mucilaginibacter sp. OK098]|uniref:vitamin K epoxide reductase family protein n=1 Tax=Mucilaginibacter sp. OK098 TaxID=1855297 RepID=UPI000916B1CF|nr:vitamin K epoxide reductase family protein [Mucilaginibacter sp. OK098]SHM81840.1 Peptidase C39 family protein [Mucilaginibacter sp. OK098]